MHFLCPHFFSRYIMMYDSLCFFVLDTNMFCTAFEPCYECYERCSRESTADEARLGQFVPLLMGLLKGRPMQCRCSRSYLCASIFLIQCLRSPVVEFIHRITDSIHGSVHQNGKLYGVSHTIFYMSAIGWDIHVFMVGTSQKQWYVTPCTAVA